MAVEIREFQREYTQKVLELLGENWNVDNFNPAFLEKMIASSQRMVLAFNESELVGFLSVGFLHKFFWGGSTVALVEDVIVSEKHRGAGIGDMLLAKAEELARSEGCYKIILSCDEDLFKFYSKNGYEVYESSMKKILK